MMDQSNPLAGELRTVRSQIRMSIAVLDAQRNGLVEQTVPIPLPLQSSSLFFLSGRTIFRQGVYALIKSSLFEVFIILAIVANCVFLALDDPTTDEKPGYFLIAEIVFVVIFTLEMVLKILALGMAFHPGAYLRDSWNVLDFLIVVLSYLNFVPGFGNFTAIRTLRVMKPLRSMNAIKGLKTLVVGLFHSFSGLVHVFVLASFIFCIFGILGVQLWGGRFRNRCHNPLTNVTDVYTFCREGAPGHNLAGVECPGVEICIEYKNPHFGYLNFDNVLYAFLIIFQVITFEGWPEVLTITSYVWSRAAIIYFFFLILIGSYFVPNLALAVINDKFNEAQQLQDDDDDDEGDRARQAAELQFKSEIKIRGPDAIKSVPTVILQSNDKDVFRKKRGAVVAHFNSTSSSSNLLSVDEPGAFVVSTSSLMTSPTDSGDVSPLLTPTRLRVDSEFREFIGEVEKPPIPCFLGVRDSVHTFTEGYSLLTPLDTLRTHEQLMEEDEAGSPTWFTKVIILAICLNTVSLAVFHYNQPQWLSDTLNISNIVFTVIFALEMCIRLFGLGPLNYFRDPFNCLDCLIVVLSILELALSGSSFVSAFRALRLLRVLKLIKRFQSLRFIIRVALGALMNTLYLNLIMFIYLFIAALAGMQFFGGKMQHLKDEDGEPVRQHFDSFLRALYTVFQVLTRDAWIEIMWNGMRATNEAAVIYFIFIVMIGNYIILSLFLAILISSFAIEDKKAESEGLIEDDDTATVLSNASQLEDIRKRLHSEVGETLNLLPPEDPTGKIFISKEIALELQQMQETQPEPIKVRRLSTRILSPGNVQGGFCPVCKTEMLVPLPTPPLVPLHEMEQYHERHCWISSIRTSRRNVLNSLRAVIHTKNTENIAFDPSLAAAIVDQARSGNMMLGYQGGGFSSWSALSAELEKEAIILDFTVGEEQVGGGLKTYVHAALPKDYHTNGGVAFGIFGPTNDFRILVSRLVSHSYFDRFILACILLSCIALAVDNPLDDRDTVKYTVLFGLDVSFTIIFVTEMLLKMIAFGIFVHDGAYLRDGWNVMDMCIVFISIISLALGDVNIGWIKVFRALRGLRPLRVIQRNRGLKMVVRTLLQSVKGIANVALLSSLNYVIFGILAVQLLNGKLQVCTDPDIVWRVDCVGSFVDVSTNTSVPRIWESETRNFDNIGSSVLTLFEVSAGELWGEIMYSAIDAYSDTRVPKLDHNPYLGLFFIVYFIISNFFLLNLFVGVVINNFNSVKSKMDGLSLLSDDQKLWVETQRLMLNFRPSVFLRPGKSAASKFCAKFVVTTEFEIFISAAILANIVVIAMDHYGMSTVWEEVLRSLNYVFVLIFLVEAVLKLIAWRHLYFTNGWNRFDFALVVISIVAVSLFISDGTSLPINPGLLRVFRIFRLFRVLRLVKQARHVRVLLETLWYSLPSIGNISIFMLLIYFIFSVLGIQFFAKVRPGNFIDHTFNNFRSFPNAMQLMFVMTTGEEWNAIMHDCMVQEPKCSGSDCGHPWAPIFFVPFMLTSAFVISNLFIAIILDNFDTTMRLDQSNLKLADLHRYVDIWSEFDPEAEMVIPTHKFPMLLARLRPPLGISRAYSRLEIIKKTLHYRVPEHGGYIHFVEVLIPLARAVMKVEFSDRDLRAHEEMWRQTFPELAQYSILRYRQSIVTVDKYFCSTYIAAAYRRRDARMLLVNKRLGDWPTKISHTRSPSLASATPPLAERDDVLDYTSSSIHDESSDTLKAEDI